MSSNTWIWMLIVEVKDIVKLLWQAMCLSYDRPTLMSALWDWELLLTDWISVWEWIDVVIADPFGYLRCHNSDGTWTPGRQKYPIDYSPNYSAVLSSKQQRKRLSFPLLPFCLADDVSISSYFHSQFWNYCSYHWIYPRGVKVLGQLLNACFGGLACLLWTSSRVSAFGSRWYYDTASYCVLYMVILKCIIV